MKRLRLKEWRDKGVLITKEDYSNFIYSEFNLFTLVESRRITNVFFKTIKELFLNNVNIYFKEFGLFYITNTKPKRRWDFIEKTMLINGGRKMIKFKPNARTTSDVVRKRGYVPMPELKLQYKYQRLRH